MAARVRRTQVERSASTRARLLDATLDCLVDRGYAGTTLTEVADRAGVSRGAQLHHYPTKAELVIAAMEHLFEKREREFRQAVEAVPLGAHRVAAAIDALWQVVSGPSFHAWLELAVAARTDEELRRAMTALSDRASDNIERTFHDLFPAPSPPNPMFELAPKFTFAVMHGMALEQLVVKDDGRWTEILEALKRLSWLALDRSGMGGELG